MKIKSAVLAFILLTVTSGVVLAANEDANQAVVVTENTRTNGVEVGNKVCPVSGDKVPAPGEKGAMGDKPVKIEYKGRIYNLCCPMCIKDFKKNPEKYSKIAEDEVAASNKQAVVYTCPMHPEVRQSMPGNCPKCGMTLEPVKQ